MKARVRKTEKARLKATGEIVEVQRLCMSSEGDIWQSATGQEYLVWMLDFDFKEEPTPKYIPDYWTRLEHTYAGLAIQGILSNPESELDYKDDETLPQALAECVAKLAHALVEKMRKNV